MGKRMTFASEFELRKCAKKPHLFEDRVSQLPEEILVCIMSFLTFKEAVRTSILSKRWINLWKFVAQLDFQDSKALDRIAGSEASDSSPEFEKLRNKERRKYVRWVNEVLQSHKAMALDELKICFELDKFSRHEIDKWLQHAFARRVQRLELNLSECGDLPPPCNKTYTFPYRALGLSSGKSSKKFHSGFTGIHKLPPFDFKSIRALTLKSVNVTGEVLEFFLHNCPFLECLVVTHSGDLISLEVSGMNLVLKHLEIHYCHSMKSIIVCDTNIISLGISKAENLVLKNVPMLVDVSISGWPTNTVRDVISRFSCCVSNLEVLALSVSPYEVKHKSAELLELPQLTKLKQLTLVVDASRDDSLIGFTSLIRASPNLEKFVLKLEWLGNIARIERKLKKAVRLPLRHLKVVEFFGYYGRTSECELVHYFLENAVALQKILVDPRNQMIFHGPQLIEQIQKEEVARCCAKNQLVGLIPSSVELEIR